MTREDALHEMVRTCDEMRRAMERHYATLRAYEVARREVEKAAEERAAAETAHREACEQYMKAAGGDGGER